MSIDTPVLLPPAPVIAPPAPPPQFGALKAFGSFGILLLAQFLAGLAVMSMAVVVALLRGANLNEPATITTAMAQATIPTLLAGAVFSAVAAFVAARIWAWDLVLDRTAAGLGMIRARRQDIALWALVGVAASAFYLLLVAKLVPFDPKTPLGPLATAAASSVATRVVWTMLALVFAPLVEEFFFRGLLLKGFSASWGPLAGGLVTTALFVSMHLFETYMYWPATVSITVLAVAAWAARRTSGSLVPPMAMHLAYNCAIAIAVWLKL